MFVLIVAKCIVNIYLKASKPAITIRINSSKVYCKFIASDFPVCLACVLIVAKCIVNITKSMH